MTFEAAPPRVSGMVILDQLQAATEEFGEEVIARAKSTLPPPVQSDIDELLPISWMDAHTVMEIKNAIAHEVGEDPIVFQKWVVRAAIGRTINKFWRALLSRVWDSAVIKRAPIVYSKTFDRGQLEFITFDADRGSANLIVTGWADMPDYDAIGLATGIEAVLEYTGRTNARVRFTRKGGSVAYHLTWGATEADSA